MVSTTFKTLFSNWRLFLPLFVIAVLAMLVVLTENEVAIVTVGVVVGVMLWLVTIYLMRNLMAGKKVKLRDGLYGGMGQMVPTVMLLALLAVESVPVMLVVIGISAGVQTEFFSGFWPIFGFGIFAVAMVALFMYLASSTLVAMVAVSAPGMYPWPALSIAHDLMYRRRAKMMAKLLILVLVLAGIWAAVLVPFVFLAPAVVRFLVLALSCFSIIYSTIYLYIYYKEIIKEDGIREGAK